MISEECECYFMYRCYKSVWCVASLIGDGCYRFQTHRYRACVDNPSWRNIYAGQAKIYWSSFAVPGFTTKKFNSSVLQHSMLNSKAFSFLVAFRRENAYFLKERCDLKISKCFQLIYLIFHLTIDRQHRMPQSSIFNDLL